MGGFGSGRWNQHNKKRTVEDCWILDLTNILLDHPDTDLPGRVLYAVRINGLGEFPLPIHYALVEEKEEGEGPYLDITYSSATRYAPEQSNERIELLSTRPNYGGASWYFFCPFTTEGERCNRRVVKLYLPPREQRFGCRECHELTYKSSQQSHKYDGLWTLLAREGEGEKHSRS